MGRRQTDGWDGLRVLRQGSGSGRAVEFGGDVQDLGPLALDGVDTFECIDGYGGFVTEG